MLYNENLSISFKCILCSVCMMKNLSISKKRFLDQTLHRQNISKRGIFIDTKKNFQVILFNRSCTVISRIYLIFTPQASHFKLHLFIFIQRVSKKRLAASDATFLYGIFFNISRFFVWYSNSKKKSAKLFLSQNQKCLERQKCVYIISIKFQNFIKIESQNHRKLAKL